MPLQPACLADRVADDPELRVIRIGRALGLFAAFAGDGFDRLDGFRHTLRNNLALEFVMRADAPGDLADGLLHAVEAPLFKI